MADQNQLSNLMPLTPEEIGRATNVPTNTSPHCPPPDILQLQTDTINVLEGRVDISSFELSYQERIKDYYRYSGTAYLSKYPVIAKRTTDTLDVV